MAGTTMTDNLELVGHIARDIVQSNELQGIDWVEITLVIRADDDGINGLYGYIYNEQGESTPEAPDMDAIDASVSAYREWLRKEGDEGFDTMLFQFNRVTRRFNIDFAYGETTRWRVTPANIDTVADELRPRLHEVDEA